MLDDSCTAIARNDARRQQDDARCQCQETYAQFKEYIQQTRIDLLDAAFISHRERAAASDTETTDTVNQFKHRLDKY